MSALRPLIAIVEDERSVRRALQRLLRSASFTVETFPSGAEFLQSLQTHRPDCVVLDLHMPGVSGFEVQAKLAESAAPVPVVVITGYDTDESRARVLEAGAAAYLRKPVDDRMLLDSVAAALAQGSAGPPPARGQ